MVVYMTTNLINGKKYIGRDKNNKKSYLGSGHALKRAIQKYGKENFKKEILEVCSSHEELEQREEYWLNYYDAGNNPNFYNAHNHSSGGKSGENHPMYGRRGKDNPGYGKKLTDEQREKKRGKNNPMYGKRGKEHPAYGRRRPDEERKKISESRIGEKNPMYGKFGKENPNYGSKRSDETRKKISESKSGEKNYLYGKYGKEHPQFKGYGVCISGNYFGQKKTAPEWGEIFKMHPSNFRSHLNGKKYKNGIKGNFFKWEHDVVL